SDLASACSLRPSPNGIPKTLGMNGGADGRNIDSGARGSHQSVVTAPGRDGTFGPMRFQVNFEDEPGVVRERSSELGRERHAVEIDAGVGEQRQAAVIGFKRGAGSTAQAVQQLVNDRPRLGGRSRYADVAFDEIDGRRVERLLLAILRNAYQVRGDIGERPRADELDGFFVEVGCDRGLARSAVVAAKR